MILTPWCLPRQGRIENMYSMTLKGQGQNLTSGQGHVVTQVGHITDVSMRLDEIKHNETTLTSLALLDQKLFAKKRLVTLGDLR